VLTSNRTREIHDALKRRCVYHWIDYPSFEKEYAIVTAKVPGIQSILARQICSFVQQLRLMNFYKRPGVAETLDWASALVALNRYELSQEAIEETLGFIFKYKEDIEHFHVEIERKTLDLDPILKSSGLDE
jgi:MoxR-like ATPase